MKKIIVTGTSSGFGLLTVKKLAKLGHTVYATMRNINAKNAAAVKALQEWASENNADVRVFELDVTSEDSVNTAVAAIAKDADGIIDVLINNAGLFIMGLSEAVSTKQLEELFQVNVFGADRVIKAVLPYMRAQKDGLLVTLSSGLTRLQLPYLGAYTATKAAIDVLGTAYHYELNRLGIDSIVIQPGAMATDIFQNQMTPENAEVAALYGETGAGIKEGIEKVFAVTPESPEPQIVADLIAELIAMPKGERPLWSAVGIGGIQPSVEAINTSTGDFSKGVQNYLGII